MDLRHRRDRETQRAVQRLYRSLRQRDLNPFAADLAARLRPLDLPALVVWGERDAYIPVRYASVQRDVFPHAEITELPDSGHWPFLDDAETVEPLVIEFLRRQLHPARPRQTTQTQLRERQTQLP